MYVYLNGRIVPEEQAVISVFDRGFLYGDGLFETIRVYNRVLFLWEAHMDRWEVGCRLLQLRPPLSRCELRAAVQVLMAKNGLSDLVVRIHLSRGVGQRGYSPQTAQEPTLVIACYPAPVWNGENPAIRVITAGYVQPREDPLAQAKHTNRLHQILARAAADAVGADEALILDDHGKVAESTTGNLFWFEGTTLCTPPLRGVLPGTTRNFIMHLARKLHIFVREKEITAPELLQTDGAFLTSSVMEITEINQLDGHPMKRSPFVSKLQMEFWIQTGRCKAPPLKED